MFTKSSVTSNDYPAFLYYIIYLSLRDKFHNTLTDKKDVMFQSIVKL